MNKQGFSLIELIVVIAIIAILAAIAVPMYKSYRLSAFAGTQVTMLNNVLNKVNAYITAHGTFPTPNQIDMGNGSFGNSFVAGNLAPSLSPYAFEVTLDNNGASCGSNALAYSWVKMDSSGPINDDRNILKTECYQWYDGTALRNQCAYSYSSLNFDVVQIQLPGMIQEYSSAGVPTAEFAAMLASYNSAVCP